MFKGLTSCDIVLYYIHTINQIKKMPTLYPDYRTAEQKERALTNPDPSLRLIGCCEKAKVEFCVCEISYHCPDHGRTCIGTHD